MRNTRIERLWVEVGRQFAREWRGFFTRLERLHQLDRKNPHHIWLLHLLFLDNLNDDCKTFQAQWNAHPLSGPKTRNLSPQVRHIATMTVSLVSFSFDLRQLIKVHQDLRLLGQTEHGIYNDDCEGMHPHTIVRYYGVDATPGRHGQDSSSESSSNTDTRSEFHSHGSDHHSDTFEHDDIEHAVAEDQERNIRHPPIPVPDAHCPFQDEDTYNMFQSVLTEALQLDGLPNGFGVTNEELGAEGYETQEILRIGKRGQKSLIVALPEHVWRPRTELWARALHVMSYFIYGDE